MSIYDENCLLRILRSFGPINLGYFNNRLRLQKLGFLAQEMGAKGDFPYSWYKRGPYSSSLAYTMFMGVEVDAFNEEISLTKEEKAIVKKMRDLLGKHLDDPDTLELFASVWYLMPNRKLSGEDVTRILEVMREEKSQYSSNDVKKAIKKISSIRE